MNIKKYLKFTLPLLILFFIFCWIIIPNFIPQLMPNRNQILLFGAILFLILGDITNITGKKK